MSSEEEGKGQVILHNKEISQLMNLATLELKQSKTAIMKVDITEALGTQFYFRVINIKDILNKSSSQIDMRLYGNIVYAIAKGIHRKIGIINSDLKDIIDMIRRVIMSLLVSE
jgi:N terminus of Rad21 / Rec8 like protein.